MAKPPIKGALDMIGSIMGKKGFKQSQDPRLAKALEDYLKGDISEAERIAAVRQLMPIRPLTNLPPAYSDEEVIRSLMANKQPKALAPVEPGSIVGNRLDIPAYEQHGVYIDTTHLGGKGSPISYGRTGHLKDVTFESSPGQAARVGLGTKEQALTPMGAEMGSGKSPFAVIKGTHQGTSDDEVRRMAQEYLQDPEWAQIGMNPYRHSQFYDKADMAPVWSAEEKLQVGPLILAPRRGLEKTHWGDPRLNLEKFPGKRYAEGGLAHMSKGKSVTDAAKYLAKLKGYADPKTTRIEDWPWKPIEEVAQRLDYPTAIPDYIQKGYGEFMQQQMARAQRGEMSPRDLVKAYGITQSSIGRGGLPYNTATKAGLKVPRTDELVRPEGAFAEWLGSTPGQRYLRAAEQGEVDERALRDIQQKFAPFGKQNQLAGQLAYGATEIPKMGDVNSALLADRDRFRTWASSLKGIDSAKPGFIGSLLGRGDVPTLDARQLNLQANTPPVGLGSIMKRGQGTGGLEAVDRLTARQQALGLDIDPALQPYYQHLAHHALWDKMGNAQTTHADLIKAMQGYAEGGKTPAWQRKEGKNPEGGLNAAGRASYNRETGGNLKPPVSAEQAKKSPKSAARRKSFCARMTGNPGPMKDENGKPTRKALALKKWDC